MTTQPESPEPLNVVAYLVTGLRSGEPSLCFDDERGDYGDQAAVFEDMVLKSDAEAAIQAARNEAEAMRADAERYRWLRHGDNDEKVLRQYGDGADTVYLPRLMHLDTAIDAAMKGDAHA